MRIVKHTIHSFKHIECIELNTTNPNVDHAEFFLLLIALRRLLEIRLRVNGLVIGVSENISLHFEHELVQILPNFLVNEEFIVDFGERPSLIFFQGQVLLKLSLDDHVFNCFGDC